MSGITPVKMPKWGLSMIEGKVTGWLKAEGDAVQAGEELVEVETSKITNVGEATESGVLRRIIAHVDDTLPVGALLAVMAPPDVSDADIDAFIAEFNANFAFEEEVGGGGGLTQRSVDAGGVRLNVAYAGEGGAGVPVVFIHGFGGDAENWTLAMGALADARVVYAIELPGHGKSDKRIADADPNALAHTILSALDALQLDRINLVGHSLGGAVALAAALAAPHRVATLTLVCAAGLPGARVNAAYIDGFIAAGRARDMQRVAEMLFADPSLATKDLAENLVRAKRIDGVEEALTALRVMMFDTPALAGLGARLGAVASPLLIVTGDADAVVSAPDDALLPASAQRLRIPGAGHMPQIEKADAFNAALKAHIA
ncbi:MAG: acetoin dehydrogenase dihydrolipoyllysine-residue acetyltransferase subunit [Hyphomonadaceae bacterium]|nr:acetoin dehydrogenase dihydrolipoyllysine-residue acetyltransferase subunit [Hyphomonadaceae bacterium]